MKPSADSEMHMYFLVTIIVKVTVLLLLLLLKFISRIWNLADCNRIFGVGTRELKALDYQVLFIDVVTYIKDLWNRNHGTFLTTEC